jgi:hypothetical protein
METAPGKESKIPQQFPTRIYKYYVKSIENKRKHIVLLGSKNPF